MSIHTDNSTLRFLGRDGLLSDELLVEYWTDKTNKLYEVLYGEWAEREPAAVYEELRAMERVCKDSRDPYERARAACCRGLMSQIEARWLGKGVIVQ